MLIVRDRIRRLPLRDPMRAIVSTFRKMSTETEQAHLFDYIEVFYNQRRCHSTLGQISPAEFERRALTQAA